MCPKRIVEMLNAALELDPAAIDALVNNRVPCNKQLEEQSEIVVDGAPGGGARVGLLGVINAIALAQGEVIEVTLDDETGFTTGFRLRDKQPVEAEEHTHRVPQVPETAE